MEARGDFLRFRSARSRPGAPAGSGFMILLPKSFQILAAGSKTYRFIENLLDFLDFLLNSSIFHDYSLICSRGAGHEARTWMDTGGDWRWGGFKSYNRARKMTERAKFFIYSRSASSKPSIYGVRSTKWENDFLTDFGRPEGSVEFERGPGGSGRFF